MPTLLGYDIATKKISIKKIRHHWLVAGLPKKLLKPLRRTTDIATIATTTISVIQKARQNPSDELNYASFLIAGAIHPMNYYLRLINSIRSYNEMENKLERNNLESQLIPHTTLIILIEALQLALLSLTTFYPFNTASKDEISEEQLSTSMQIAAIGLSNFVLRPLEYWLLLKAGKQIKQETHTAAMARELSPAQKQILNSEYFIDWYKAGLSFENFYQLSEYQHSIINDDSDIFDNYVFTQLMTVNEALSIPESHVNLFKNLRFLASMDNKSIDEKKKYIQKALQIKSTNIHLDMLDKPAISSAINSRPPLPLLIAIQFEEEHENILIHHYDIYKAIMSQDPTGKSFLKKHNASNILENEQLQNTDNLPRCSIM